MKKLLLCGLFVLLVIISPVIGLKARNDYPFIEYNYNWFGGFFPGPNILNNDDTGGSPYIDIQIVKEPRHGQIVDTATGVLYYQVTEEGYHWRDNFTYRLFDGKSYSNTAIVTISIVPSTWEVICNGRDAIYYTAENTALSRTLPCPLSQDRDMPYRIVGDGPMGEPIVQHGLLILTSSDDDWSGQTPFKYIPEPGFTGVDGFKYTSRYDSGMFGWVYGLPGHVTIYVNTPVPTPEFPSAILPATMIIGFLGAVLLIKRTREN